MILVEGFSNIVIRFPLLMALLLVSSGVQVDVRQQSGDVLPQQDQREQIDPHNTMEILPPSYIGCWRGVVAKPDSIQNLNGCLDGPFVPELYTLCYRKKLNGKFELTFGGVQMDTDVPAEYQIGAPSSIVEVLSSDGTARVTLRSLIHFDQNEVAASSDSKWSMDEKTDMACEIKNGTMEVNASYTQTSDGTDCFKGTWHTRLRRFDD
jgi:hypothetical protein